MADDINFWLKNRERLVGALFEQYFFEPTAIDARSGGNFWWLLVRILNRKICCRCDWCLRVYDDIGYLRPPEDSSGSLYCRLSDTLNTILEKNNLPLLNPYSGCILDPSGDGVFMWYERNMFAGYSNIEVKKKFITFMHNIERKYIEYLDSCRKEKEIKGERCSICFENINTVETILPCGHFFHKICINPWLDLRGNCPICRGVPRLEGEKLFGEWLISQNIKKNNININ